MKKIIKTLKIIGISLLVLVFALILGRNIIVPVGAKICVKAMTGLTLKMDKFSIGLFSTKLDIQGLKIYNPKGYEDKVMLDLPRIYVDYDLGDIIGGKIHLNDVKFFLNEFMLIKRADGSSNLDGIMKLVSEQSDKSQAQEATKVEPKKEAPEVQIDLFELKVGKFISKVYSESGKVDVDTISINIDKRYENKTIEEIASDLSKYVGTVLLQMALNLDLGNVSDVLKGIIDSVGKLGVDAVKMGVDVGMGAVGEAEKVLKNTTDGLKNIIKLPFGRK